MKISIKHLLFLALFPLLIWGEKIETFYGPIEVEEPVLLELIEHPAFQRLKSIHQYGVSYYTTHPEEYTRYDHSLGVFALLRTKGAPLKEQIAGLLHDVSHTAFSHVGDWIFGKQNGEKDYQNSIHRDFLKERGLEEILLKYGIAADEILPTADLFPALEDSLPNLCADRIDYNIQGAFHQGFITYNEALAIFEDLQFIHPIWVGSNKELLKKLTLFSLHMTEHCWGSPTNHLSSLWLAEAILRGVELGDLSYEEIHFGVDQLIWNKLISHQDPLIRQKMTMLIHAADYYSIVSSTEKSDLVIKSKFRGIDPWILWEGKCLRLTSIDPPFAQEYERKRAAIKEGWPIIHKLPAETSYEPIRNI